MELNQLTDGVFRLCIPFENLYTTVFVLTEGNDCILFDTATTKEDVTRDILPALRSASLSPSLIVCSHLHGDHAGGAPALLEAFPTAKVGVFAVSAPFEKERTCQLVDGDKLLDRFTVLNLKGHTNDCLALHDEKTNLLISGDCLQLQGIGRYGTSFESLSAYMHSIERVRILGVDRIVASHDYLPLGFSAEGTEAVKTYLDTCRDVAKEIAAFAHTHAELSPPDLAAAFHSLYPDRPPVGAHVFAAARA